jgi:hypothetical protein
VRRLTSFNKVSVACSNLSTSRLVSHQRPECELELLFHCHAGSWTIRVSRLPLRNAEELSHPHHDKEFVFSGSQNRAIKNPMSNHEIINETFFGSTYSYVPHLSVHQNGYITHYNMHMTRLCLLCAASSKGLKIFFTDPSYNSIWSLGDIGKQFHAEPRTFGRTYITVFHYR